MQPLPAAPFEISTWSYRRKVNKNAHVVWAKNFYSVPFSHIGSLVDLRVTDTMLEVYRADPSHLAESDPAALPGLYRDAGYLGVAIHALGIDRVTGTLRNTLSPALPPDLRTTLARTLRLLEREAHHLRPPFPVTDPGHITRQLGFQAMTSGDSFLADSARHTLRDIASTLLVPQWSTSHPHPALIRTLTGHTNAVTAVAMTPDGARALTASRDGTARIWDLATGTALHTLTGHTAEVIAVAITPDGTRALTGSRDGTARMGSP